MEKEINMQTRFTDVLDSVESLSDDEKEMLVDIVRNRMIEHRRIELGSEVKSSRLEFETGLCETMSADEVMEDILS